MIRLAKDPEIRYSSVDGKPIARFTGACNRAFKKDGQPDADFFNFVAFGKTAETIEKYCKKGTKILVDCTAQNNNYTDKEGIKRYEVNFIINRFDFCESKSSDEAFESSDSSDASSVEGGFMDIPDGIEDELPFS